MANTSVTKAKNFIRAAQLPLPPPVERGVAAKTPPPDFRAMKDQTAVVGSELISFSKDVSEEQRRDVCNAVLLAQLVAKRKVPSPASELDVEMWYRTYFDALSNIGFAVQDHGFTRFSKTGKSVEVHEAILEVAAAVLAGSPGALALVNTALKALQKLSEDSPWITLFDRESQSANTARFQVSAVEGNEKTGFFVSILAFGLEARTELTQVLFFKFHSHEVKLFHQGGKVSINEPVLASVRQPIAAKLTAFANDFIRTVPDDLVTPKPSSGGGRDDDGPGTDRGVERNNINIPTSGGGEYDI